MRQSDMRQSDMGQSDMRQSDMSESDMRQSDMRHPCMHLMLTLINAICACSNGFFEAPRNCGVEIESLAAAEATNGQVDWHEEVGGCCGEVSCGEVSCGEEGEEVEGGGCGEEGEEGEVSCGEEGEVSCGEEGEKHMASCSLRRWPRGDLPQEERRVDGVVQWLVVPVEKEQVDVGQAGSLDDEAGSHAAELRGAENGEFSNPQLRVRAQRVRSPSQIYPQLRVRVQRSFIHGCYFSP